jgi:MFS family permease
MANRNALATQRSHRRQRGQHGRQDGRGRLGAREARLLLVLGLPSIAVAFATTVVSAYLPVVARKQTSSALVVGMIVAGEGLTAMVVPLVAGAWSDRFRERNGSRLLLVASGTPLFALSLLGLAFVRSPGLMALLVVTFFAGNFLSYEPYRALYPDLIPAPMSGRAQASQAVARGLGTVIALAGGGVMLTVWLGLPFVTAAAWQVVTVTALIVLLPRVSRSARGRRRWPEREDLQISLSGLVGQLRSLVGGHPELRLYLLANCLWELSLGALKTFIVLYVTVGLGRSLSSASLIIGAVAVVILLGAIVSGKLGDRFGKIVTMRWGLIGYGLMLLVPIFTRSPVALLVAVPVIAFGGGLTMTLPYAILMPLMPEDSHGIMTGFYSLSRGLGVMLGPLPAGAAIQLLGGAFTSTHGYAAMWIVTSAAVLVSIPVLDKLRRRVSR